MRQYAEKPIPRGDDGFDCLIRQISSSGNLFATVLAGKQFRYYLITTEALCEDRADDSIFLIYSTKTSNKSISQASHHVCFSIFSSNTAVALLKPSLFPSTRYCVSIFFVALGPLHSIHLIDSFILANIAKITYALKSGPFLRRNSRSPP